jgi:HSP20 family molecular chaperone IbpA
MAMYAYDQVLADVRRVYEQLTGLPAPKVDIKNPRFPLPRGVDPVALVQSEINHLNLYLINSGISLRLSKVPTWMPATEIYETPEAYVIELEIAGVRREDVNVQHLNNILIVRGTRRFRRPSETAQYHNSERAYGVFERLFPLPNYVQPDNPEVSLSEGILKITLRKIEATAQTKAAGEA